MARIIEIGVINTFVLAGLAFGRAEPGYSCAVQMLLLGLGILFGVSALGAGVCGDSSGSLGYCGSIHYIPANTLFFSDLGPVVLCKAESKSSTTSPRSSKISC